MVPYKVRKHKGVTALTSQAWATAKSCEELIVFIRCTADRLDILCPSCATGMTLLFLDVGWKNEFVGWMVSICL